MIKKVAVLDGTVRAFEYQSTTCEEIEVEVPEEFLTEPMTTEHQIYQFKVVDGKVVRKTEEEIKADPQFANHQKEQRAMAYKAESDALFFKYQRDEITKEVWLEKVAEIKARYPY